MNLKRRATDVHTRAEILTAIDQGFAPGDRETVLELLDRYGTGPSEPERERVQWAVLQQSNGELDRVRRLIEAAKQDHRDVLWWYASPPGTPRVDDPLLEVVRSAWGWAMPRALRVVAVNPFGNVIVACEGRHLWLICPDSLRAVLYSETELATLLADDEFLEDWESASLLKAAQRALGPLAEGQCYGFKVWPVVAGDYSVGNLATRELREYLATSGEAAREAAAG
jgi:hypothetical protein